MKKLVAIAVCLGLAVDVFTQCNISFSLGPDTTVNCNTPYTIYATPGLGSYHWSNGSTDPFIVTSQAGLFWCIATDTLGNVVVNGDFSQGQTGFQSDYVPGTGGSFGILSNEGTYAVTANPNYVHTNFASCYDHTQGNASGSMLVVNGSSVANQNIWRQVVNVQPNTTYIFSIWAMSVVGSNPGQLNFSVNGVALGSTFTLPAATCQWASYSATWYSGANTTADIAVVNQNTAISGNDFAIDDILFSPICQYADTIIISHPPSPVLSPLTADSVCPGQQTTLSASADISGSSYTWQPGSLSGSPVTVNPNATTTYTVVATSPQNCSSSPQTVTVTVMPVPAINLSSSEDTICAGSTVQLTASSSVSGTAFSWQPGNLSGNFINVNPQPGNNYTVTATSPFGCTATDTISVFVRNLPTVSVQHDWVMCEGDTITITATSGQQSTFTWYPGNETTASVDVYPVSDNYYWVTATFEGCTSAPDTAFVTVAPLPVLTVPDDVEICPGESFTAGVSSSVSGSAFTWAPGNLTGAVNVLSPDTATTYFITAESSGCFSEVDSFTVSISQNCNCVVIVPDVFSPNGDNMNDVFYTTNSVGCNFKEYELLIYNRWGNLLWKTSDPAGYWDGGSNTEGTYYWVFHYIHEQPSGNQQKVADKGFLTIFR